MLKPATSAVALVLIASLLGSACTPMCGASSQKLQSLRRGMSYEETAQIMGCSGSVVSTLAPTDKGSSTVEWDGPDSPIFSRTQIDFQDGKLLSFTTGLRGGL